MSPEERMKIFWKEVDSIRQRNAPFFSEEQKKYIQVSYIKYKQYIYLDPGHQLSSTIILEIELAFKLVRDL